MRIKTLLGSNTSKVLVTLFKNKDSLFHVNMLSKHSKVPVTTTLRILKTLVDSEIVEITLVGKLNLYKIKQDDETELLGEMILKNDKKK